MPKIACMYTVSILYTGKLISLFILMVWYIDLMTYVVTIEEKDCYVGF